MSRPLRVAHFAVDDGSIYVADDAFPAIAQIDRRTGSLQNVFWWDVSDTHRRRCVSNSVALRGRELLVSSPSAGGLVRIDITSGRTSLIALDEAPGPITVVGETIWVSADANWAEHDEDARDDSPETTPRRPVVWEGPHGPDPDWDEADDDFSWDVPRPVWRIVGDAAERVDLGGDATQLTPISAEAFLFVLRRPDDPVAKTWNGDGGGRYRYPGVLARCDARDTTTELMDLPETSGLLVIDGNRCWLAGFGFEVPEPVLRPDGLFGADPSPLHEVDIERGRVTRSPLIVEPDAIVDNIAISIADRYVSPGGTRRVSDARSYDLAAPERSTQVELPRVVNRHFGDVVVRSGNAWFAGDDADALVWIDAASATVGLIPIDVDLTPNAPAPRRPEGVDLEQFEQSQFAALRDSLGSEWHDEEGNVVASPFIDNVQIESVELRGRFPNTHVVVRYRATYRPGIAFARRLNLYDELGNTQDLEDADMYLYEDIDSGGAPPVEECEPDADGIVWF